MTLSRRKAIRLLCGAGAATLGASAAGLGWLRHKVDPGTRLSYDLSSRGGAAYGLLPPTPACGGDLAATRHAIEGPFYRPSTPERAVLRDAQTFGRPLVIEGYVLTRDCRPVAGAVLDFWGCDGNGVYDNEGYRLRGHQFTDAAGRFRVETVKPGAYRQFGVLRAPHVHIKAQGRDTALLTTQLFFPGEPHNADDWLMDDGLVMEVKERGDGALAGRFDFVLTGV